MLVSLRLLHAQRRKFQCLRVAQSIWTGRKWQLHVAVSPSWDAIVSLHGQRAQVEEVRCQCLALCARRILVAVPVIVDAVLMVGQVQKSTPCVEKKKDKITKKQRGRRETAR